MKANEVLGSEPKPRRGYQAFELSAESRAQLANVFPPKFNEFIGHHITFKMGARETDPLPVAENFKVVGYGCNDDGIEALVVEVDGTTKREDGRTYHITWSLDRSAGFKPVNSNDLLAQGWVKIPNPINITATAKFF